MRISHAVLVPFLFLGCASFQGSDGVDVVRKFGDSDYNGKTEIVRQLEINKDVESLRALCGSKVDWSEMAATSLGARPGTG